MAALLAAYNTNAQTVVGMIFNQKNTQIKLYLQQIAALGTFCLQLKSGYKTVSGGLKNIADAKNGEYGLHSAYFSSLSNVSPAVAGDPHIKAIMQYAQDIQTTFNSTIGTCTSSGQLTGDETGYLKQVSNNVIKKCNADLDELSVVTTPGKVKMTDDERLKRIAAIYADMSGNYSFTRSFCSQWRLLVVNRAKEANDISVSKQLYNLK